jgi:hypothetical protein
MPRLDQLAKPQSPPPTSPTGSPTSNTGSP